MTTSRCACLGLCLVTVLVAEPALGQSAPRDADFSKPVSKLEGYTGREMSRIYSESIGRGFTASSYSRFALQGAQTSFGGVIDPSVAPTQFSISSGSSYRPSGAKPFASASPGPTVSPYLNLFSESFEDVGSSPYVQLVRPMLEQQRMNQQFQLQQQQLDRRVQQIAAQPAFAPQGSQLQYPTGHPTVFMNTGRYYPGNFRRR